MPDIRQHESVTFRVDPGLKAELVALAKRDHRSLGALLRDIARKRIEAEHQRSFAREARRQSLAAARMVREPGADEAAVLRELDADLEAFDREWT